MRIPIYLSETIVKVSFLPYNRAIHNVQYAATEEERLQGGEVVYNSENCCTE